MPKQMIRYGKSRLARFQAIKVYSFEISKSGAKRRAGVHKIGA